MAEKRKVVIDLVVRSGGAQKGVTGLQRNVSSLNKGTVKAKSNLGGMNKNLGSAKRGLAGAAGGMGSMGLAAGAAGAGVLALGAVVKGSVSAFASFDDKMNQSVAIMGNVSDAMRTDMSMAAREMAKATRFSADEAAESYFFLASAGLDAKQSIAALPAVAKFGQAGMFDMALATDLLTDAQSSLGLTVDDSAQNLTNMTRVSDVFVKANTLANTSVQQVSEAITNKLGGSLKAYNIELEEGVAVLAAYADQGLKGASAGESFNIVLRDLKKAASDNADAFADANIAVFDSEGNFRNMADVVLDLENAFMGLSVAEQTKLANDLGFQDRSFKNIQLLLGQSEAIRGYEEDLRSAGGITEEVAGKQMQSFSAQMDVMKSNIVDAGISLGEELAPMILEVGKGLVEFIGLVTPLIVGLVKLQKVLFKFTPLGVIFKGLGAALKGFAKVSELWDPAAKAANDYRDALDGLNKQVKDGTQPAAAYANSLVFLAQKGELTVGAIKKLGEGVEFVGEEQAEAIRMTLQWTRAQQGMGVEVAILELALLDQVDAMGLDTAAAAALREELGLVRRVASRARGGIEQLTDEEGNLVDATGRLIDAQGQLIDETGHLIDAEGNLIDETGNVIDETLSLADALAQAEVNQEGLAGAMRAFADPAFAAITAIKKLKQANEDLIEVQEDHHSSAEDIAAAQIEVAIATLEAQGALDEFSSESIATQVKIIADVLKMSDEAARGLLETLGIIDETKVEAEATVVFTASGSFTARKAVAGPEFGGIEAPVGSPSNISSFLDELSGQRAHGGPVGKGGMFLVGEKGPEIFVPQQSGAILPNAVITAGGSPGTTVTQHFTFVTSGDVGQDAQLVSLMMSTRGLVRGGLKGGAF